MKASILDQVLDCFSRPGESLYLVKDHERFPANEADPCPRFQQHEELVKIIKFLLEKLLYLRIRLRKIYYEVRLIFFLREFPYNPALAHAPCPLYEQCACCRAFSLPFENSVVDFSFHGAYHTKIRPFRQAPIHIFRQLRISFTAPF